MRDWKRLNSTNTFQEMVNLWNQNQDSSEFLDGMVGTILSNGVLYNGNETIAGKLVRPLENVELSGQVDSDTYFDNFTFYFRDTNKVVPTDMFPVDLLNFADGKPHFLYIKEDLTYRISDYMFGKADEVLLARFVINQDFTWNQMYIMAQRAGTPMYNAADEFYDVTGCYIKSPGGLNLSTTSGTIKRSGIDFTDKVSPDLMNIYNLASEAVPIRYINTANEIDYSEQTRQTVITNKYMEYNMNKKLKIEAEQYIAAIQNLYYMIEQRSNIVADELHTAIVVGGDLEDLQQIVQGYTDYIDLIYQEVNKLYELLGNSVLSTVRRAVLRNNYVDVNNYLNTYLKGTAIAQSVTEQQVQAIRTIPSYILLIDSSVTQTPLDYALASIQDDLNAITFNVGQIKNVATGKFTIQRILWDIYEGTLILQYGDKVYDTFQEAIAGTDLVEYPAPFGKTIYIPMAIMIIKSGTTNINDDIESIIIDRRWIEVDQEMTTYADYVARAKADKARELIDKVISGEIPSKKADSLKCTVNNVTVYKDGDYFLNYDNLNNKPVVVNDVTHSSYNAKQILSAYQGYLLEQNKVNRQGEDTKTGILNTNQLKPTASNTYDLGATDKIWKNFYVNTIYAGNNQTRRLVMGGGSSYTWIDSRDSSNNVKNAINIYDEYTSFRTGYLQVASKRIPYSNGNSVNNITAGVAISSNTENKTVAFTW